MGRGNIYVEICSRFLDLDVWVTQLFQVGNSGNETNYSILVSKNIT
jgi:hypothetical protein